MTLPRKLMIDGEKIVASMRTHVKVLFVPFVILVVVAGVGGFLLGKVHNGVGDKVIIAIMVVLIVWGSVFPFVKWYSWTYTVTNKRLVEQKGVFTRIGRIIPLSRINDVAYEKNLSDRILGCGTLIIHDASEQSGLQLHDVPHVEAVHRTITNLLFETPGGAGGAGGIARDDESV